MRILLWHVHGGWTDAFVRGGHEYLLPTTAERDAWGLGRGGRDWPVTVHEVAPEDLAGQDVDVVVVQRPEEIDEAGRLLGRVLGRDVPAVYVEHNAPPGAPGRTTHPLATQREIPIVHVTHFNRLMWDNGRCPTVVVEHGIPDPGPLYTGDRASIGCVVNEPVRRGRVAGLDVIGELVRSVPGEMFGMGTQDVPAALGLGADQMVVHGDLRTDELHPTLAGCRAYLHPYRWTSLGLSLLEAMHLAMPVLVLDTTEASRAVPPEAGALSCDPAELAAVARLLRADPDEARRRGAIAREAALARYSLGRFLLEWQNVLDDTRARARHPRKEVQR